MKAPKVRVARVYESPTTQPGFRVLVDRLWPRGVSKEAAAIDLWAKSITPSNELRKWFHSEEGNWEEFRARYEDELADLGKELEQLIESADTREIVLVTASRTPDKCHVNVLAEQLQLAAKRMKSKAKS